MSKFEVGDKVRHVSARTSDVHTVASVYADAQIGLNNLGIRGDKRLFKADYFELVDRPNLDAPEDQVNNPRHYASGAVECIDAIEASMTPEAFKGYLKGNIIKYMWRYEKKVNPVQDLEKAQWYQKKLIETEKK